MTGRPTNSLSDKDAGNNDCETLSPCTIDGLSFFCNPLLLSLMVSVEGLSELCCGFRFGATAFVHVFFNCFLHRSPFTHLILLRSTHEHIVMVCVSTEEAG